MILLATVLLEPNRWKNREHPLLRASEWTRRAATAGFESLELWENHWLQADEEERAALLAAPMPVSVYNTYARFDCPNDSQAMDTAFAALRCLRATALKFNVGPAPGDPDRARAMLLAAASALPAGTRLRCECHPGTWLETPEVAAAFFESVPLPVEVIVHAFAMPADELSRWFAALGPRITCVHVQCRDEDGRWSGIARHPARSHETLRLLADHGFVGDYTLEFTAGTAAEGNDPKQLWESAIDDLAWLRAAIPR